MADDKPEPPKARYQQVKDSITVAPPSHHFAVITDGPEPGVKFVDNVRVEKPICDSIATVFKDGKELWLARVNEAENGRFCDGPTRSDRFKKGPFEPGDRVALCDQWINQIDSGFVRPDPVLDLTAEGYGICQRVEFIYFRSKGSSLEALRAYTCVYFPASRLMEFHNMPRTIAGQREASASSTAPEAGRATRNKAAHPSMDEINKMKPEALVYRRGKNDSLIRMKHVAKDPRESAVWCMPLTAEFQPIKTVYDCELWFIEDLVRASDVTRKIDDQYEAHLNGVPIDEQQVLPAEVSTEDTDDLSAIDDQTKASRHDDECMSSLDASSGCSTEPETDAQFADNESTAGLDDPVIRKETTKAVNLLLKHQFGIGRPSVGQRKLGLAIYEQQTEIRALKQELQCVKEQPNGGEGNAGVCDRLAKLEALMEEVKLECANIPQLKSDMEDVFRVQGGGLCEAIQILKSEVHRISLYNDTYGALVKHDAELKGVEVRVATVPPDIPVRMPINDAAKAFKGKAQAIAPLLNSSTANIVSVTNECAADASVHSTRSEPAVVTQQVSEPAISKAISTGHQQASGFGNDLQQEDSFACQIDAVMETSNTELRDDVSICSSTLARYLEGEDGDDVSTFENLLSTSPNAQASTEKRVCFQVSEMSEEASGITSKQRTESAPSKAKHSFLGKLARKFSKPSDTNVPERDEDERQHGPVSQHKKTPSKIHSITESITPRFFRHLSVKKRPGPQKELFVVKPANHSTMQAAKSSSDQELFRRPALPPSKGASGGSAVSPPVNLQLFVPPPSSTPLKQPTQTKLGGTFSSDLNELNTTLAEVEITPKTPQPERPVGPWENIADSFAENPYFSSENVKFEAFRGSLQCVTSTTYLQDSDEFEALCKIFYTQPVDVDWPIKLIQLGPQKCKRMLANTVQEIRYRKVIGNSALLSDSTKKRRLQSATVPKKADGTSMNAPKSRRLQSNEKEDESPPPSDVPPPPPPATPHKPRGRTIGSVFDPRLKKPFPLVLPSVEDYYNNEAEYRGLFDPDLIAACLANRLKIAKRSDGRDWVVYVIAKLFLHLMKKKWLPDIFHSVFDVRHMFYRLFVDLGKARSTFRDQSSVCALYPWVFAPLMQTIEKMEHQYKRTFAPDEKNKLIKYVAFRLNKASSDWMRYAAKMESNRACAAQCQPEPSEQRYRVMDVSFSQADDSFNCVLGIPPSGGGNQQEFDDYLTNDLSWDLEEIDA